MALDLENELTMNGLDMLDNQNITYSITDSTRETEASLMQHTPPV